MYRVLDLIFSDEDFDMLKDITEKYESGKIKYEDFIKAARYLMHKYNRHTSDIWRYEYAVLKGNYEEYFRLILATLRFKRPIKIPGDWKHYNYHWIQVLVFTIDPRWEPEDITKVSEQIINELPEMWNRLGGGVRFDETYSIYDPPEVLTPDNGFTKEKYSFLKTYLSEYDDIARNVYNWENYRPPADFKNAEHILSHYIVCGIEEDKEITPELDLLSALLSECPCVEGEDIPVSESLTVYAGTDISQRCVLWKKSGWRRTGAKYIPPKSGKPPEPKPPGRPKKKEKEKEIKIKKRRGRWINPMKRYNIYSVHQKFWNTLLICKKFGLNPIPLRPNSKLPAIEWKYLQSEPIRPEHFEFFKDPRYNIGIMAGYNNIMIADLDVPILLNISNHTLTDKSIRGYHYYFKVDKLIEGRAFTIREGKCKGKSPLGIISARYVVAPPSIVDGKEYKWITTDKLLRVRSDSLIEVFEDFFNEYYDQIKKLFEPYCNLNEVI